MHSQSIDVRFKLAALWAAFTPGVMFAAAVIVALPSLMVFLSLSLPPAVNRWTNVVLGIVYTLLGVANIATSSELGAYLLLLYGLEGVLSLLIVWHAWRWSSAAHLAL